MNSSLDPPWFRPGSDPLGSLFTSVTITIDQCKQNLGIYLYNGTKEKNGFLFHGIKSWGEGEVELYFSLS